MSSTTSSTSATRYLSRTGFEIDTPTLPLAELLLAKMQIVKINEKDLVDMIALLLEHPFGESDGEILNVARIAKLCAEDWGLWRTSTMNLEKLQGYADSHAHLDSGQKARLLAQVAALRNGSMPSPSHLPGGCAERSAKR